MNSVPGKGAGATIEAKGSVEIVSIPPSGVVEQQRGAGFATEDAAEASLIPAIDFHPDHHHTFWKLETIYQKDAELGLALTDLDKGLAQKKKEDRVQGYLEPKELAAATTDAHKAAVERFRDIERLAKGDASFDPYDLRQLTERHPEVAAMLAKLDRPHSICRGHSDSYKVSRLSPEMQARFRKIDQALREELEDQAWAVVDDGIAEQCGPALLYTGSIATFAGIMIGVAAVVGPALAVAASLFGATLVAGGGIAMGFEPTRSKRAVGRVLRWLTRGRATRRVVVELPQRFIRLSSRRGNEPLKVLKKLKRELKATAKAKALPG